VAIVKFKRIEQHLVVVTKDMTIEESDIIEQGLSVDRFKEIMNGNQHSEQEWEIYFELLRNYSDSTDINEDWVSNRTGDYEQEDTLVED
jgi:hypothetical protein